MDLVDRLGDTMARIFTFPNVRKDSGPARPPPEPPRESAWRELWRNPITQAVYRLLLALIIVTWPVLKWLVGLDLVLAILRIFFGGGILAIYGVLHIAVIGGIAYLVLNVPPLPRR